MAKEGAVLEGSDCENRDAGASASGKDAVWRAPRAFWYVMAALVALVSSSMLLHESASWSLDYADAFGMLLNVRAQSCDAHALGLVFGFALTQASAPRLSRVVLDARFWTVFFLAQCVDVMAFYWLLLGAGPILLIVVVQFVGAASGAFFFVVCSQTACRLGPRLFLLSVIIVVALSTAIVQGLFSVLETGVPPAVPQVLHVALVIAAAACFARAMAPGSCLRGVYEQESFAPIRAEARGDGRVRRVPSYVVPFSIVGAYGAVFGFLHVVPLALPLEVTYRVATFLLGALAALALFSVTLQPKDATEVTRIWNRFYGFVFPVVTVATLLAPLTVGTEFLPSLIMQACALYYFDMLLAVASYAIARTIHAAPSQVFARAFLIKSIGFFAGCMAGSYVHETMRLDTVAFSVIGAVVFVLLVVVTFHTNADKYAKTVWGLLPHEDPHGRVESRRAERCRELASRHRLTEREAEVLVLLAAGKRPKEVSENLVVSITTVRSHVRAIYAKLDVHSHDDLVHLVDGK